MPQSASAVAGSRKEQLIAILTKALRRKFDEPKKYQKLSESSKS